MCQCHNFAILFVDSFECCVPFIFCFSLYRGKVGLDVAEAQHLMDGLDWQGAVKDIRASVNWLKANGSKKVWLLFTCWIKIYKKSKRKNRLIFAAL